jgi:hypothetical protein
MPAIYGGATLTIVAASAESCTNGFLHDRAVYEPGMAPILLSESQKSVAELVSISDMKIRSEPVDTPGWTYQERILSKRIMSFGSHLGPPRLHILVWQRQKPSALSIPVMRDLSISNPAPTSLRMTAHCTFTKNGYGSWKHTPAASWPSRATNWSRSLQSPGSLLPHATFSLQIT